MLCMFENTSPHHTKSSNLNLFIYVILALGMPKVKMIHQLLLEILLTKETSVSGRGFTKDLQLSLGSVQLNL